MSLATLIRNRELVRAVSALIAIWTLSIIAVPALAAPSGEPQVGDWFEYDYNTYLDNGYGEYYGYAETMRSHSRYEITQIQSGLVTVHRIGGWTWQGSDGSYDFSDFDTYFRFDLGTREYYNGEVDVDFPTIDPRVWFWIPPSIEDGSMVQVLDDTLFVTSHDSTIWNGWFPYKSIALEISGTSARNDVYGNFNIDYWDNYYFDKRSGFIVAEEYNEWDYDYYGNTGFHWRESVMLTDSSFTVPYDPAQLLGVYIGIPLVVFGAIAVGWRAGFGPRTYKFKTGPAELRTSPLKVRVKQIWSPKKLEGMEWAGSTYFAPLVPVFASRALNMLDPVVIAVSEGKVIGLAIKNRESAMGTVFAEDPRVAKALLKRLHLKHFFLDTKEENWNVPGAVLVDAFDVLMLKGPRTESFDASRIRPMTETDLTTVTRIAQQVYKGKAKRWIHHSFKGGDVGFVAVDGGRVVGFAFATVAGKTARLHTLTVEPNHRSRGLGGDLMAARLNTLAALGVEEVLVEISRFNLPSISIARKVGFIKVGESAYISKNPDLMLTEAHRRL
jgi:L-amino acid N-acyltransferase YncA